MDVTETIVYNVWKCANANHFRCYGANHTSFKEILKDSKRCSQLCGCYLQVIVNHANEMEPMGSFKEIADSKKIIISELGKARSKQLKAEAKAQKLFVRMRELEVDLRDVMRREKEARN